MDLSNLNSYQSVYTGKQIDDSLGRIVNGDIDQKAEQATAAAAEATASAQAIKDALDNLPEGAVPVIDDLTTGGSTAALSAGQGVTLKGMVDSKVPATRTIDGKPLSSNVTILPTGGLQGQALVKASAADRAVQWGPWPSNPNLLDNWYFVYPINQRNIESGAIWPALSYGIDRFCSSYGRAVKWVRGEGIHLMPVDNSIVDYRIEEDYIQAGAQVTFSAIINGKIEFFTFAWRAGDSSIQIGDNNDIYLSYGYNLPGNGVSTLRIWNQSTGEIIITAVKLELGSHQTLAHQDASGNWVLNDPTPDKATELAKCQRYFQKIPVAVGGTNGMNIFNLDFLQQMRQIPTVVIKNNDGNTLTMDPANGPFYWGITDHSLVFGVPASMLVSNYLSSEAFLGTFELNANL